MYRADFLRWQLAYLVRAVIAEGGSATKAAKTLGVSRVFISRVLNRNGYGAKKVKRMAKNRA